MSPDIILAENEVDKENTAWSGRPTQWKFYFEFSFNLQIAANTPQYPSNTTIFPYLKQINLLRFASLIFYIRRRKYFQNLQKKKKLFLFWSASLFTEVFFFFFLCCLFFRGSIHWGSIQWTYCMSNLFSDDSCYF